MNDKRNLRNADRDHDVRARFAALRREEERLVPEFASLWRGRPGPSRGRARWLVAACVLIMLAAILWRVRPRQPQDLSVASITEWKAPTDFLLETPGRELLRTVPAIGEWPGYAVTTPLTRPAEAGKKALH